MTTNEHMARVYLAQDRCLISTQADINHSPRTPRAPRGMAAQPCALLRNICPQ